ncbi:hypothetical protein BDZ45DRAFT_752134 [Acephala macrosclerotiorum]|nr:hypothetical protein BDZ45DRAFT_752134 [Acephala macrosclerotiorum]
MARLEECWVFDRGGKLYRGSLKTVRKEHQIARGFLQEIQPTHSRPQGRIVITGTYHNGSRNLEWFCGQGKSDPTLPDPRPYHSRFCHEVFSAAHRDFNVQPFKRSLDLEHVFLIIGFLWCTGFYVTTILSTRSRQAHHTLHLLPSPDLEIFSAYYWNIFYLERASIFDPRKLHGQGGKSILAPSHLPMGYLTGDGAGLAVPYQILPMSISTAHRKINSAVLPISSNIDGSSYLYDTTVLCARTGLAQNSLRTFPLPTKLQSLLHIAMEIFSLLPDLEVVPIH